MELQKPKENKNLMKKQIEISLYAIYLLGGKHSYVHQEDIYQKCFELDPSNFSWDTKDYPSDLKGKFAIKDIRELRKKTNQDLLKSKGIKRNQHVEFMLTDEGVSFVETNLKILEKGSEEKEILDTQAKTKEKRVLANLHKNLIAAKTSDDIVDIHNFLQMSTDLPPRIKRQRIQKFINESKRLDMKDVESLLIKWLDLIG